MKLVILKVSLILLSMATCIASIIVELYHPNYVNALSLLSGFALLPVILVINIQQNELNKKQ